MQHLRVTAGAYRDIRQQNSFILSGMTASHALFHGFRQSLLVLLPNVRDTMGLSDIQATSISAVQEVAAGCIDLPSGVVMDMLKRHWGLVMTLCTVAFGIGWLIIGLAPICPILLLGMAIVAAASSLWHLPLDRRLIRPLCRAPWLCPVGTWCRQQYRRYYRTRGDGNVFSRDGLAQYYFHVLDSSPIFDLPGVLGLSRYWPQQQRQ